MPIFLYLIVMLAVVASVFVAAVFGFLRLIVMAIAEKFKKEPPVLSPRKPRFEPYMVYLPRPGCEGCGMAFISDEEKYCRWCGHQREYQEIEIAYS